MKVYRIEKETVSWKVSDVIAPSFNERIYSDKRLKAESLLENVRKSNYPYLYSRGNSLFVFPADDKLDERAFHWASTYAPLPDSSCVVSLLELEVDNVEWHDSRNYEDLCFLLSGFKCGMRDITANEDDLCKKYWVGKCNMEELSIEGLVNKARVIGIVPYIVTHNKISKLI